MPPRSRVVPGLGADAVEQAFVIEPREPGRPFGEQFGLGRGRLERTLVDQTFDQFDPRA